MIQTLDSDFWTACGTHLQEGNGSYIVSYFDVVVVVAAAVDYDYEDDDDDDDDDDDVNAEMIPVITGATGTISRTFRKYLSKYQGSMKSKKYNKRKTAVLDVAHICNSESTNVWYKTRVTC